MKFELKSVKYAAFASEETSCYEAALWINGIKTAMVSNDGHGGCDYLHPIGERGTDKRKASDARIENAESYLAAQPEIQTTFGGDDETFSYKQDIETKCGDLLEDWLLTRDVKKALRTKIMFLENGDVAIHQVNKLKPTAENIAKVREQKPEWDILNEKPLAEVIKAWKASS